MEETSRYDSKKKFLNVFLLNNYFKSQSDLAKLEVINEFNGSKDVRVCLLSFQVFCAIVWETLREEVREQ